MNITMDVINKYLINNVICLIVLKKKQKKPLQNKFKEETESEELTLDGSVDLNGHPAIRTKSGRWAAAIIILCKLHKHKLIAYLLLIIFYHKFWNLVMHINI